MNMLSIKVAECAVIRVGLFFSVSFFADYFKKRVLLKSGFRYLYTEFNTKAKKTKRPQNGTGHYKIIKRVNQRASAGTTSG